jgi:hypothetical protein
MERKPSTNIRMTTNPSEQYKVRAKEHNQTLLKVKVPRKQLMAIRTHSGKRVAITSKTK